jgi:hypothetical protein
MASSSTRYLDHTQRCATVGRTPLGEQSARHRDLYLTTHTTNINVPCGIRTHDRSRRAAVDLRLRLRSHWDRHTILITILFSYVTARFFQEIHCIRRSTCCTMQSWAFFVTPSANLNRFSTTDACRRFTCTSFVSNSSSVRCWTVIILHSTTAQNVRRELYEYLRVFNSS